MIKRLVLSMLLAVLLCVVCVGACASQLCIPSDTKTIEAEAFYGDSTTQTEASAERKPVYPT